MRKALVVGLVASPQRIAEIRRHRLLGMNDTKNKDYIDIDMIMKELAFTRRLCARHQWTVIDVTRRSIEETAAAIIKLVEDRSGQWLMRRPKRAALILASASEGRAAVLRQAGLISGKRRPISMSARMEAGADSRDAGRRSTAVESRSCWHRAKAEQVSAREPEALRDRRGSGHGLRRRAFPQAANDGSRARAAPLPARSDALPILGRLRCAWPETRSGGTSAAPS